MQRLGRNAGRYCGECIPIWDVLRQIDAAARATGWESETFYDAGERSLPAYRWRPSTPARRLYLSAGIHGDEPSGPLCLRRMFEEGAFPKHLDITVVPCLNPVGFARNTRENEDGVDLNRDYRNPSTAVVRAHVAWLNRQEPFELTLLLHEDWEANGFYVYEVNPDHHPSLGEKIVEAVAEICPIETATLVDSWTAERGIIRPDVPPEERPQWAEALWLIMNKSRQSYTLETPSDYPLPLRVQAHTRALEAVWAALKVSC